MAGKITANVVQLGDSATASQNFHLKTNVDGSLSLNRGNDGASLGSVLSISAGSETVQRIMTFTAQSATGTSIDFTGIPSWAKEISVMFDGISTNGASLIQIQFGSGSIQTSGYKSTASYSVGSAAYYAAVTTGFTLDTTYVTAPHTRSGSYLFNNINNTSWVGSGNNGGDTIALVTWACAGRVSLSGTLDRIRITTVNGTDLFDAGTINILVKG